MSSDPKLHLINFASMARCARRGSWIRPPAGSQNCWRALRRRTHASPPQLTLFFHGGLVSERQGWRLRAPFTPSWPRTAKVGPSLLCGNRGCWRHCRTRRRTLRRGRRFSCNCCASCSSTRRVNCRHGPMCPLPLSHCPATRPFSSSEALRLLNSKIELLPVGDPRDLHSPASRRRAPKLPKSAATRCTRCRRNWRATLWPQPRWRPSSHRAQMPVAPFGP